MTKIGSLLNPGNLPSQTYSDFGILTRDLTLFTGYSFRLSLVFLSEILSCEDDDGERDSTREPELGR